MIAVAAGHSGGHIIPALTLAQKEHVPLLFFAGNSALDHTLLQNISGATYFLPLGKTPRGFARITFACALVYAFFTALYVLVRHQPTKVISTGSIVAIPVCLAGWLLRIPIELYELNVEPGKTIAFLSRFARTTYVLYEQTKSFLPHAHCIITKYPIRFGAADKRITKQEALTSLGFCPTRSTIFVLGGSQGSVFLNNLIKTYVTHHAHTPIQVIHQTGTQDDWHKFYQHHRIPALTFTYADVPRLYAAADLVICRAGAGTLAELIFFEKRALIIPLQTKATSHQLHNAQAVQRTHPHLITIAQQTDEIERICTQIQELL